MTRKRILTFRTSRAEEHDGKFQPERMILARTRRGMTKTDLSALSDLSKNSLSKYEKGDTEPKPESVERLAAAMRFPVAFFYEEGTALVDPEIVSFRALARMPARHRDMVTGLTGHAITKLEPWLDDAFGWPDPDLPDLSGQEPAAAAAALRSEWGLGFEPITNVVRALESKGVRIFSLRLEGLEDGLETIDALSLWWGNKPYIFMNVGVTPERMRFNLCHELAHLVLHQQGPPSGHQAESEANSFAGHFLIPSEGLHTDAHRYMPLEEILEAKRRWKASAMAFVYRLHEEEVVDDWRYRELCITLRRDYGKDEPKSIGEYESSSILYDAFAVIDTEIGRSEVADRLLMSLDDLEDMVVSQALTPVRPRGPSVEAPRLRIER